ncbi:MAG: asparagine synthase (glutamine-hydrolyzing), partial [Deltaproteobacteria bacterium]|nr:asparagine synthase (glutamine-hydrolyzing) [Deltaproteobacteria bacterium]
MCGICGKINFDKSHPVDAALLERMADSLHHRGPDDTGITCAGPVGLGHKRLSIIDLSTAGRQPMSNEDGSLLLVFNGEIYNFEELRRELKSKGHCFTSQTDSEVILHLYEEEYTDCVKRLRGMFAFALWDQSRRQLMLSRDRAGQKPLVYAADGKALIFASEIKALLQDPAVAAEVDPEAIHHYLTYQYIPGPGTIFKGIKKLPPAHTLILKNGSLSLEPYWQLSYEPKLVLNSETEYTQHLLDVFRESVKIRLRSDV